MIGPELLDTIFCTFEDLARLRLKIMTYSNFQRFGITITGIT